MHKMSIERKVTNGTVLRWREVAGGLSSLAATRPRNQHNNTTKELIKLSSFQSLLRVIDDRETAVKTRTEGCGSPSSPSKVLTLHTFLQLPAPPLITSPVCLSVCLSVPSTPPGAGERPGVGASLCPAGAGAGRAGGAARGRDGVHGPAGHAPGPAAGRVRRPPAGDGRAGERPHLH